ncbi:MAG: hypothetical protein P1V81_13525, partial [Planctomycetota bacterium]|nr:hypothetical protein [Planctomycetota bacterium]
STFVVENCVGPVVLSDISSGSILTVFDTAGLAQVRSSPQVLLDGCELRVLGSSQTSEMTPALLVENSEVHVNGSMLLGGSRGMLLNQGTERDGAPGIRATDSVLRLSRSESLGGAGTFSSVFFTTDIPTEGGAGIEATGSFVFLRGGTGNLVSGGLGQSGFAGGVLTHGLGGAAVEADVSSLVTSTSDAQLVSGADSTGVVSVPLVAGGAAYLGLPVPLATLESTDKLLALGMVARLELGGEPGGLFLTYFSAGQGPAASAPPIHGLILLDTQTAVALATTTLDGAGAGALSISIPSLPTLVGLSVLAQGFSLGTNGEASFSSPTFVGIL